MAGRRVPGLRLQGSQGRGSGRSIGLAAVAMAWSCLLAGSAAASDRAQSGLTPPSPSISSSFRAATDLRVDGATRSLDAPPTGRARADTLFLTLERTVEMAVEEGQEVAIVRARAEQAEDQITQVRAGAFPEITTNMTYTRTVRSIFDGFVGEDAPGAPPGQQPGDEDGFDLPFGQPNVWVAGLQVTQPIWTGGRVRAGLDIARGVREVSRFQIEEAEAEVTLEVRTAYFQAVFSEELVEIARESLELAEAQLRQVEQFEEQGQASDFDVLNARVERDNLRPRLVEARNARDLAVLELKRLANIPRGVPVRLVTPLEAELAEVDREALRGALPRRPALQAAEERIRIEDDRIRVARAGRLPEISAFADFSYQAFPGRFVPSDANWLEDWTFGFQVSLPLFDGFRTGGEMDEARALRREAELEHDQARTALEMELDAALAGFDAALAEVEARRATVGEAERALELAELRFEAGSATALELSNSRLLLQQARVNEVEALLEYVDALARMERATGGVIPVLEPRLLTDAPPPGEGELR